MARYRISVLRKMSNPDLAGEYCVNGEAEQLCSLMEEGREFIAESRQPEGSAAGRGTTSASI